MASRIARNEPCGCGSGFKHKDCCARRRTPSQWLAIVSAALFALAALWIVLGVVQRAATEPVAPPGKVWSAEHGHWHDAENPGEPQPPGPPPPGKVWSAEHGHWHDAPAVPVPPPGGPPPPGKVWSAEHGHWHDAAAPVVPSEEPAAPAPPAEAETEPPTTNNSQAVSNPDEP